MLTHRNVLMSIFEKLLTNESFCCCEFIRVQTICVDDNHVTIV